MNTRRLTAESENEDVVVSFIDQDIQVRWLTIEDGDEFASELLTSLIDARKARGEVRPPDVLLGALAEFCDLFNLEVSPRDPGPMNTFLGTEALEPSDTLPTMNRALDMIFGDR